LIHDSLNKQNEQTLSLFRELSQRITTSQASLSSEFANALEKKNLVSEPNHNKVNLTMHLSSSSASNTPFQQSRPSLHVQSKSQPHPRLDNSSMDLSTTSSFDLQSTPIITPCPISNDEKTDDAAWNELGFEFLCNDKKVVDEMKEYLEAEKTKDESSAHNKTPTRSRTATPTPIATTTATAAPKKNQKEDKNKEKKSHVKKKER